MPIYEYACKKCGKKVEVLLKVSERGPTKCAACGGALERLLSRNSFQLKGGGWYRDLYSSVRPGGSGGGGAAKTEAAASSPAAAKKKAAD